MDGYQRMTTNLTTAMMKQLKIDDPVSTTEILEEAWRCSKRAFACCMVAPTPQRPPIPARVVAIACGLVAIKKVDNRYSPPRVLTEARVCACDRCTQCFQEIQLLAIGWGSVERVLERNIHGFCKEEEREDTTALAREKETSPMSVDFGLDGEEPDGEPHEEEGEGEEEEEEEEEGNGGSEHGEQEKKEWLVRASPLRTPIFERPTKRIRAFRTSQWIFETPLGRF